MPVCIGPCGQDRPLSEYRTKNTQQWPNYRFPKCLTCEQDEHNDKIAAELQSKGYVVTKSAVAGGGTK